MNNKTAQEITDKIIEMLDKGVVPWERPWTCEGFTAVKADPRRMAVSHATGKAYSLLNQLLIGDIGEFATFKQIKDAGGMVKRGAKSKRVYFWKSIIVKDKDENGNPIIGDNGKEMTHKAWFLKGYAVFNIAKDTEGVNMTRLEAILKAEKDAEDKAKTDGKPTILDLPEETMRKYITREGINFGEYGNRAFYMPSADAITVPPRSAFKNLEAFYGTAFHEIGHSTGTEKRLNRRMGGRFGSYDYGREELVAEMTSAFICNSLGITTNLTENSSYIDNWKKAIKGDMEMVVYAAGKAEKALEFILTGKKPEYSKAA